MNEIMEINTLPRAVEAFAKFEKDTQICGLRMGGVPVWELIRFRAFQALCVKAGIFEVGHPITPRSLRNYFRFAYNIAASRLTRPFKVLGAQKLVVLGHSRLLPNSSNRYEDPYSEAYLPESVSSYYLEMAFRGIHFKPRVPGRRVWIDDKTFLASRAKARLAGSDQSRAKELEEWFEKITGQQVPIKAFFENSLGSREVLLPLYEKILKKAKPSAGIVAVGYERPEFIEACRALGIPVVEIQHGAISNYHYGYHHNTSFPSLCYPDHLWLWGSFWKSAARYAPQIQLHSVGFPLFEKHRGTMGKTQGRGCLFLSQGSVGRLIADEAKILKDSNPDLEVYFRLHPSEFDCWEEKYHDLPHVGISVLGAGEGSLYEWFEKVQHVVGGYSTALFEAAGLGCKVGVLNLPGIEYMEPLIAQDGAFKIDGNWNAFLAHEPGQSCHENSIFEPFSKNRVASLLQSIAQV